MSLAKSVLNTLNIALAAALLLGVPFILSDRWQMISQLKGSANKLI